MSYSCMCTMSTDSQPQSLFPVCALCQLTPNLKVSSLCVHCANWLPASKSHPCVCTVPTDSQPQSLIPVCALCQLTPSLKVSSLCVHCANWLPTSKSHLCVCTVPTDSQLLSVTPLCGVILLLTSKSHPCVFTMSMTSQTKSAASECVLSQLALNFCLWCQLTPSCKVLPPCVHYVNSQLLSLAPVCVFCQIDPKCCSCVFTVSSNPFSLVVLPVQIRQRRRWTFS